jgi:hypothetical protein
MKLARSTYYYRSRHSAAEEKLLLDRIETLCGRVPPRRLSAHQLINSARTEWWSITKRSQG